MARYIDEYPATWRKGAVFHERALDLRAGDRDVVAAQRRWLNAAREVALVSHLLLDRQSPNSDHDQTPRQLQGFCARCPKHL
jgi:hypothetical protein